MPRKGTQREKLPLVYSVYDRNETVIEADWFIVSFHCNLVRDI